MYIADRKAREAVETRATLEKKLAQKEKEKKEMKLRELAEAARMDRSGLQAGNECTYYHLGKVIMDVNVSKVIPERYP